ncbi:MAG TPA: transketolase C-terminal domain-containing protein [Myxococcota bacterium]|nr:transketolase C-terminal domain-containing protein [Myxococcota bacterium]
MTRLLMTGNAAAAWGARLADVDYVPAFPITPQTEIVETLEHWREAGEIQTRVVMMESEHSAVAAAGAAALTGVRVFTATSSQGLLYAMEMLYTVAGWRAPFVLVNVSRGIAAPITLEPDHQDVLAARDSGFLQIHCASVQEVLDAVLLAHRWSEHPTVRLPVIVNLDGFHLSFTREPVEVPDAQAVSRFLPPFDPGDASFRASKPVSRAVAVLGGGPYSYFRYQMHRASEAALAVHETIAVEFQRACGRRWDLVEVYRAEDAEIVFFLTGSYATKARDAVDHLRAVGIAAGLVRPRVLRPYPREAIRAALRGKRGVVVLDQNLSMGQGGVLHTELAAALYGWPGAPKVLASFVGGLGGRDVVLEEFREMAHETLRAAEEGRESPRRLLYTAQELREVRKLQGIALAEREDMAKEGM